MSFLSDLLLAAAALGAAVYCFILSRRLSALSSLDGGLGNAIAVLSSQVDDLTKLLQSAQKSAGQAGSGLASQTARAEHVAKRLELLVASMHDLPPSPAAEPERAPTRWPLEAGQRPARTDTDDSLETPPARARVLRRRREHGEA